MSIPSGHHIASRARLLARLVLVGLVLIPVGGVVSVAVMPEQLPYYGGVAMAGFPPRTLPPLAAAAAFAALMFQWAPGIYGLVELRRLFRGYADGAIFTVPAAKRLHRCGVAVAVVGITNPISSALLSMALSIGLPDTQRAIVLSISGLDPVFMLIGGAIALIARVMMEAARIADENAGFI